MLRLVVLEEPRWLTDHYEVLVVRPARILLILVVALILRALVNRSISRLARAGNGGTPGLLKPLREKALPLLEQASLVSQRRRQRAETIASILRSITSAILLGLAFVLALGEAGINLTPIIASAGVAGIAFGFGAQNLVKDFLSGVFMLLEDQYGVGDVVDVGEASGTVEAVGLRTTRLRDMHGTVWYVRNGEIIRVGNKSQGYARVVLDVPMSHRTDLDEAGKIMKETADALRQDEEWQDYILEEPKYLGVEQINADGVVLRLTVKTRPGEQWRVGRELRLRIMERFDADQLELASPAAQIFMSTERNDNTGRTTAN